MRRLTLPISMLVALALVSSALSGCAARRAEARAKLPVAESVCLQIEGGKEQENDFLLRRAKALLAEREYRVVDSNCELKLRYVALDHGRSDVTNTSKFSFRSMPTYHVEGLVTVWKRSGEVAAQDMHINLRDYESKKDVLEALAWKFVAYVVYNYRPN